MSRRLQQQQPTKTGMKRQRSQRRHREVCWATAFLVCVATLQSMHTIEYGESFVFSTPPSTAMPKQGHTPFYNRQARTPSIPTTRLWAQRKTKSPTASRSKTQRIQYKKKPKKPIVSSDVSYLLMNHELLTKEEEYELGVKIQKFVGIRQQIEELIDRKKVEQRMLENERRREKEARDRKKRASMRASDEQYLGSMYEIDEESDDLSMEEELEEFLMAKGLDSRSNSRSELRRSIEDLYGTVEDEDDEEAMMEELGMAIYGIDTYDDEDSFSDDLVDSPDYGYGGDNNPLSGIYGSAQLSETLDDVRLLTERDIVEELGVEGGRKELVQIMIQGALARQQMIKSNVRLVASIAKKWYNGAKGSGTSEKNNGNSDNAKQKLSRSAKMGDWTTPSMDEAVQQGIVGLAKAAERFDPNLKYKFSTYAQYYITNEVRQIFNSATTQCLYVPPYFFNVKNNYQKIVREHYSKMSKDPDLEPLSLDAIAKQLGVKSKRLKVILDTTRPLVQLDAPVGGVGMTSPGKAGGNDETNPSDALVNSLSTEELSPEEVVEQTLLRQCLENALAAELLPLERDVVRLRHGLDDGQSRTHREVVESSGGMLSINDVRALESQAYKKLRFKHSVHAARLRDFAKDYIGVSPEALEMAH